MTRIHIIILAAWLALALLTGCAGRPATASTVKVRVAGEVAKARVRTATTKVQKLKAEVPVELQPEVQSVEDDLVEATAQLETQTEALEQVQKDIDRQAAEIVKRDAIIAREEKWAKFGKASLYALFCAAFAVAWKMTSGIPTAIAGPWGIAARIAASLSASAAVGWFAFYVVTKLL
jgi:outer membrane murein-binding lipoprotein Lpp